MVDQILRYTDASRCLGAVRKSRDRVGGGGRGQSADHNRDCGYRTPRE